ncbi:MAG: hypothetical protein KDC15_10400 [Chitinophagaceae bacterium]|nr:hypothetical protein [Chitinophagaceae bacterium]
MTFKSFLECDFTGSGNFKALLCAAVGFNLWHYITVFSYSLLAALQGQNTCWALWEMSEKVIFSFSGGKDKEKLAEIGRF